MVKVDWDGVLLDLQGQGIPIVSLNPGGQYSAPTATPAQRIIIEAAIEAAIEAYRGQQESVRDDALAAYDELVAIRDNFDPDLASTPDIREAIDRLLDVVLQLMELQGLKDDD